MPILTHTMSSPLLRLRIARRRVALAWRESEWMQPLTVAAAVVLVMLAAIVLIVWAVW